VTDLRIRLAGAADDVRRMTICSVAFNDIVAELPSALAFHTINFDEFAALGLEDRPEGYVRFLEQMPSVRVNAHLHAQWLRSPQLPVDENDLNDWCYVGAAIAYADIVVTERHFAHVVSTGNLVKKAAAISDLADLARV
jgi:hypothetical protein